MAIHLEGAYFAVGCRRVASHTEAAAHDTVLLPLFPGLSEEQQGYVIDRLALHCSAVAA